MSSFLIGLIESETNWETEESLWFVSFMLSLQWGRSAKVLLPRSVLNCKWVKLSIHRADVAGKRDMCVCVCMSEF